MLDQLIGKTVDRVTQTEYGLTVFFTDGTILRVQGHTFEDSELEVEVWAN